MFRNGPEVDGGGTAYLGPTTIIEMTIPMSQSSSDATLDDSWVLAGPITSFPCSPAFEENKQKDLREQSGIWIKLKILPARQAESYLFIFCLTCLRIQRQTNVVS